MEESAPAATRAGARGQHSYAEIGTGERVFARRVLRYVRTEFWW